jgi:hypothetical protein
VEEVEEVHDVFESDYAVMLWVNFAESSVLKHLMVDRVLESAWEVLWELHMLVHAYRLMKMMDLMKLMEEEVVVVALSLELELNY